MDNCRATAMLQEEYSLAWKTYSGHLRDMMKEIMCDEFTDVTLVCEDKKKIKAHKNILSACSPVFKDIVKLEQSAKSIIYLKGVYSSELESIMQFIYLGEATYYEMRMSEFLSVARSLEIKELCTAKNETNNEDEPSPSNPETSTGYLKEQTIMTNEPNKQNNESVKSKYDG